MKNWISENLYFYEFPLIVTLSVIYVLGWAIKIRYTVRHSREEPIPYGLYGLLSLLWPFEMFAYLFLLWPVDIIVWAWVSSCKWICQNL